MVSPTAEQRADRAATPRHVAIIMDGNSRWAAREGVMTALGHRAGVEAVRRVIDACEERGVEVLTLFTFSSENWGRPEAEVRALMALFSRYLRRELEKLQRDNIRLRFIGRRDRFSPRLQQLMARTETATRNNTKATLVLAADYGGRWDVAGATRDIAQRVVSGELSIDAIDENTVGAAMSLADIPAPDLCIRSGGDVRISNFLLWQFAYTELYFTECLWPDFDAADLDAAFAEYSRRERRYGMRKIAKSGTQ